MVDRGFDDLASLVAADVARGEPFALRAILGTTDPIAVAAAFRDAVRALLGREIVGVGFFKVSVGAVAAAVLDDGARVVVKARGCKPPRERIAACQAVTGALSSAGFPCPRPMVEASLRGETIWTVESWLEVGAPADAHAPAVRGEIAARLHEITVLAEPVRPRVALGRAWFTAVPRERVFPTPHTPLFDLTRPGAAWIDDVARAARAIAPEGRPVVGHFDWRSEHLRFQDGRLVASWDWDALHDELEPVLVGAIAHGFTADFERIDRPVPTLDEALAFVDDYASARGAPFTLGERRTALASLAFSTAYSARCEHGIREGEPASGDGFRRLLAAIVEARLVSR